MKIRPKSQRGEAVGNRIGGPPTDASTPGSVVEPLSAGIVRIEGGQVRRQRARRSARSRDPHAPADCMRTAAVATGCTISLPSTSTSKFPTRPVRSRTGRLTSSRDSSPARPSSPSVRRGVSQFPYTSNRLRLQTRFNLGRPFRPRAVCSEFAPPCEELQWFRRRSEALSFRTSSAHRRH